MGCLTPRNLGIVTQMNTRLMDGVMKDGLGVLWRSGETFWTVDLKYESRSETVGQRGVESSRLQGFIDPRKTCGSSRGGRPCPFGNLEICFTLISPR